MIPSILNYDNSYNLVLFEDSLEAPGDDILLAYIYHHIKDNLKLLCVNKKPEYYKKSLKTDSLDTIEFSENKWVTPSLFTLLNQCSKGSTVVVDSISPFLWDHDIRQFSKELLLLISRGVRLFLCLNIGTNWVPNVSQLLRYQSNAYFRVVKRLGERQYFVQSSLVENKVKHLNELLTLNDCFEVASQLVEDKGKEVSPQNQSLLKNLTTFNLGENLNEIERRAKNQLLLPYLRAKENKLETEKSDSYSESYDSDDPDEDLEV